MKNLENVKSKASPIRKTIITIIALIIIISICIVITLIYVGDRINIVKEEIQIEDATIVIEHLKDEEYIKEQTTNDKEKITEISKEDSDYIIDVSINKNILKDEYMGDFQKYKEVKTIGIESENITTEAGIQGFGYYNKDLDEYQITFPYKETEILNLKIKPKVKFKETTAKSIFEREDIQKIIKNIKI